MTSFYIGDPGNAAIKYGPEIKPQNELVKVIIDAKAEIERLKELHWTQWRKKWKRYELLNGIILETENYNLKINQKSMSKLKTGAVKQKADKPPKNYLG